MRHLFVVMIALAFLGCFHEGVETEVTPAELPVVEYPCPNFDRGDWVLLVELPRRNLNPDEFRMVKEWIDPILQAYVDNKDFLFVILKPGNELPDGRRTGYNIRSARFYLEAPGLLHDVLELQIFHFPDPNGHWFTHWDRAGRDRTQAGFTVEFNNSSLFGPKFGTSLDGVTVGGAPEIKVEEYNLRLRFDESKIRYYADKYLDEEKDYDNPVESVVDEVKGRGYLTNPT